MNEYEKQANDFATKYGVKLSVIDSRFGLHLPDDKQHRHIFKMKLQRGRKAYTFEFGQSIAAGNTKPTMYDILACLEKNDVGSFEDFCGEFGYEERNDMYTGVNKASMRTYKAVCKEYEAVYRLFSDVMEELQEIQ